MCQEVVEKLFNRFENCQVRKVRQPIGAASKFIENGLTFDDVLIVPKRSSIFSRGDVSLKTRLVEDLTLDLPIISANMDTVTELDMASAMAELSGMGVIHRFP